MDSIHFHNGEESSVEVPESGRIREITPLRGHTMKEYDEKLSQLKKENFKLKLRIYFLEENSSGKSAFNGTENPEALIKYEELKNEAELTRNELNEKQGLLFDAMLALDAMEEKLAEEQRQRNAEVALLEERIMQLEKEVESSRCPRSPGSPSGYDYKFTSYAATCDISQEALSPRSSRSFAAVAAHVRDLQEQASSLELALCDETANSNRLREQLKMEREIRHCQEDEIKHRFQNSEEQAATILQLTVDLQRQRERCADLQESLAQKEELKVQLENELREREARVSELEEELDRLRAVQEVGNRTNTRSTSSPSLKNGQQSLDTKSRQWTESEPNDATVELSRLRIDYNLALQNMARFLRRSRIQQAALERAERREQQLLEEIRELRAACSAAKTDLSCIKDQLSPASRLSSVSPPSTPNPDLGDHAPTPKRSRTALIRSTPSLLSWVLQSISQNAEEDRFQNVYSEEEHLRHMQLVGILSLLSRMATVVNNMVDINPEGRHTLQSLTEAAILLCSSSSDLQPLSSRTDMNNPSAVLLDRAALQEKARSDSLSFIGRANKVRNSTGTSASREIPHCGDHVYSPPKEKTSKVPIFKTNRENYGSAESAGNRNAFCANDKIHSGTGVDELIFRLENSPEVAEVGSDVTLRMKVQVVSQSETLENGISSATLVPCVTYKGKACPVKKGEHASTGSSYMLLQDAWFQLEEARLLCEKLEAPPLISDAESPQANHKPTPPKNVCDVAIQAASQPQLLDFVPSGCYGTISYSLSQNEAVFSYERGKRFQILLKSGTGIRLNKLPIFNEFQNGDNTADKVHIIRCTGLENSLKRENVELRSQLRRSRRILQQTYAHLAAANERKRLVEDVMCNQLIS